MTNDFLVKKFEESIDKYNSTIITAVCTNHGIRINDLIKIFGEENISNKENFVDFYFNLKIAFFNKGYIIDRRISKNDEITIFFRYKNTLDKFPRTLDNFKCENLIISKDLIKDIQKYRELTSKHKIEYGFYLQFGDDGKIFSTTLVKGKEDEISFGIPLEGYGVFGDFHVHTFIGYSEDKTEFSILPSQSDMLVNIERYLVEKEFNYAAMIIASVETNKISIFMPKRSKPDLAHRNCINRILETTDVELETLKILTDLYITKIVQLGNEIIINRIKKKEPNIYEKKLKLYSDENGL